MQLSTRYGQNIFHKAQTHKSKSQCMLSHVEEKTILLSDSWNQPALKKGHYLFCTLFFFDTIPYNNIYYFSSKSLNYSLKTTFLSWKKKIRLFRIGGGGMTSNKSGFIPDLPSTIINNYSYWERRPSPAGWHIKADCSFTPTTAADRQP